MSENLTTKQADKIKEILKKHDIRISIYSCGCCHGISMDFEYQGEKIVWNVDNADIEMFDVDE